MFSSIKDMSSSSNYDSSSTPVLPSRNVVYNNIRSPTAQIDNLSVNLINGVPPPTAPPIVAPVGSILSVTSPGVASFSSDIDVLGNIELAGNSGTSGQFIKKTGASTQNWSSLSVSDIPPGANSQVLTTFSGSPGWNLLTQSNFAPNTINSSYFTNALGLTQVGKLPIQNISPGTTNQLHITNGIGASAWSSTASIPATSITFNADVNQTALNYFNEELNTVLPITFEDGTTGNVDVSFQRIGNKVSARIDTRSVTYLSVPGLSYRSIGPIPSIYRPLYGVAVDLSDWHGECIPCEQTGPGFVNGAAYVGLSGIIRIYTNTSRSVPVAGTLVSFTHTMNYMID